MNLAVKTRQSVEKTGSRVASVRGGMLARENLVFGLLIWLAYEMNWEMLQNRKKCWNDAATLRTWRVCITINSQSELTNEINAS